MPNTNYDNIFKFFKSSFESNFNYAEQLFASNASNKKYIHNYEFGAYREELVRKFLKAIIPNKLEIGQGFLINGIDQTSTQMDLVIYDRQNSPLLEDQLNNRFFPVESVVGIGEVKSVIKSKSKLKEILIKLAKNKNITRIRNPRYIIHREDKLDTETLTKKNTDHPFSFLICKKLDFDLENIENEIREIYQGVDTRLWHNLIFSIEDGYIGYQDSKNEHWIVWYPVNESTRNKCIFRTPGNSGMAHFRSFVKAINILSFSTTIYRPEIINYISEDKTGEIRIEKK